MSITYLWTPKEIRNLSSTEAYKFGLMRDFTYNDAHFRAKTIFGNHAKLICTIEPQPNSTNKLQMITGTDTKSKSISFEITAMDTCYPILNQEWDVFLRDEKAGMVRHPMELWAVDGDKYTAPI